MMRILPMGPRAPVWKRLGQWVRRFLRPPRTELEFMEAVVVAERERRFKDAVRLCQQGLDRFSGDYYLLMKRLSQAREAGDRPMAEGLLERAMLYCPPTAATLSSIGEEYAYLGKMEEAEAFFRKALERTPTNSLIREKLAMSLIQQRKMEEGIAELGQALDAEPANTTRRDLLAQSLLQAEKFDEVVECLEGVSSESLSWESLMCLSIARARLDGADSLAENLLHPAAVEET